MHNPDFPARALSELRGHRGKQTRQSSRFGAGGLAKTAAPVKQSITLRRKDYEAQKAKAE